MEVEVSTLHGLTLDNSNEITKIQVGGVAVHMENIQIHLP